MSESQVSQLATFAATVSAAFFLAASVLVSTDTAHAAEPSAPADTQSSCRCPDEGAPDRPVRPKLAGATPSATILDESDEIAALAAVQIALSETADGNTYVWHRRNGRLSGLIHPVSSYKSPGGRVCRHIVLTLVSGLVSKRTEGSACRLPDGVWSLEG